jgi:hypothetical protein
MGEMLFTHFGVSGPLVLSASAHMRGDIRQYRMFIDLKPALDDATLDARLISDLAKYGQRDFVNSLSDLLPQKLIDPVIRQSRIDPRKKSNAVTREERAALRDALKKFPLTPVSFRKADLVNRLKRSDRLYSGEETWKLIDSGEEGVEQMRALLGLIKKVTNVNLPNRGQIANLPLGSVVETNAVFSAKDVTPVMAGEIPACILPLVSRANYENDRTVEAAFSEDLAFAYEVFAEGHLLAGLSEEDKKELFKSMYEGTKNYLGMYK